MPLQTFPYACMHTQTDKQVENTMPPPSILWAVGGIKIKKHKNPFTLERTVNLEATVLM